MSIKKSLTKKIAQGADLGRLSGEVFKLSRKYGPESDWVLAARMKYAQALFQYGEYERARGEFSAVVERRRASGFDVDDDFLRESENGYSNSQIQLKNFEEAEREFREMAVRYDRVLGFNHGSAIGKHENHAMTLFKLGRVSEAEREAAVAASRRAAAKGEDDPDATRAREVHALYLRALERHGDTEALSRK